jgi:hypothetical protein
MRKTFLVLFLMAVSAPAAGGPYLDGNDLLRKCAGGDSASGAQCFGYLEGAVDQQDLVRMNTAQLPSCLPAGTEIGQVRDAVVSFLRKYPALRTEAASSLVGLAVAVNWNCPVKPENSN